MVVSWVKCQGGQFCPLETVDISDVYADGVYIIWHNLSAKVIYVGQGNIADRLTNHRSSPEILAHRGAGLLLVSWAEVSSHSQRLCIERYLHRVYTPLMSTCSIGQEIEVNLPN
jgi:hypothetical protein